jgi:Cof subfamily protein (haloacid dehalogenase superfamily)
MKEKPLAGVLVVSDVDNTLLTEEAGLPQENLEAIRRFCALGGSFTLATGRNVPSARRYLEKLPINAPVILLNGGLIYDFEREMPLNAHYISREKALPVLQELIRQFPSMGFEVMTENMQTYVVRANTGTEKHLRDERFSALWADAEKVPGRWFKVLCAADAATCIAVERYCKTHFSGEEELLFLRSAPIYFEILPTGISKGTALHSLCRILGVRQKDSCAIGDYDNDVELLKAAGFAVAVANAPARVQRCADLVTGSCMEGGVAMFLNALMEEKLGKTGV